MKKEFIFCHHRALISTLIFCSSSTLCFSTFAATSYTAKVNQLSRQVARQNYVLKQQSKELQNLKKQVSYVQHNNPKNSSVKRTSLLGWQSGPFNAKISGQVNMAGMISDDGHSSNLYFVTNSISNNRLRLETKVQNTPDFSIGSMIELGFKVNPGSNVSQVNKSGTNSTDYRRVEIMFNSKKLGKVSLGKGSTASDSSAQADLSGTDVVSYSKVDDNGSGIFFRNAQETKGMPFTGNPTVGDVYNNLDGQSRQNRVRYDTPTFHGFTFATSYMANYVYDFALSYLNTFSWVKLKAAIAYVSAHSTISSSTGTLKGNQIDGSISALFNCGFNITYAAGKFRTGTNNRQNPYFHFVKLGYLAALNHLGKTAFSINYNFSRHFNANTDKGESYGAAVVQNLTHYNTELYVSWQKFILDRINSHYNAVNLFMMGARYKFG